MHPLITVKVETSRLEHRAPTAGVLQTVEFRSKPSSLIPGDPVVVNLIGPLSHRFLGRSPITPTKKTTCVAYCCNLALIKSLYQFLADL